MKMIDGDLIELALAGHFDTIVHGCNCIGVMGAGIAKQIAEVFPSAARVDREALRNHEVKPGGYSKSIVYFGYGPMNETRHRLCIINAYTQRLPGPPSVINNDSREQRLDWIQAVFRKIAQTTATHQRIGLPLIGAGLAGGNWTDIERIIDKELSRHYNVSVVRYKPKEN